ncbi:MAG: ATP-binding protein [Acidimicrobiales bacterium]
MASVCASCALARSTGGIVSPTRSFTFLFTDIEGSTRLLARLGADRYAALLAEHHRIIRDALSAHDGTERDTQGDAFFATFESPSAGLGAAIDVQRVLATQSWPEGEAVRVRMGIHAGEASETATGLVGEDVHRAARIAGAAHGGQVVLSESAAAMVRDRLSGGTTLRDLGQHRLKDLGRPVLLFQLEAEGLERDFPRLRSLDNPELPNNLPSRLSTFVGRVTEVAAVRALVESHRLVTVAGAGGSGKTRLALEVAAQLLDANREGAFFVDLASVGSRDDVPMAIQSALGLRGQAGDSGLDALLDTLESQETLIVLDNCEHVVDECARIAELIEQRSRAVHLLATSREPLGIDGERVYRLGPLSLPPDDAVTVGDLADSDAVELFVERIRMHDAEFSFDDTTVPLLASICRRLDGVPFALELAAARLRSMSLFDLHERLDHRFGLLTSGSRTALPRQRTLQATLDWSYDLLGPGERDVLDHLSVFVASFDLAAAEEVCPHTDHGTADVLASLVDKSLVAAERAAGELRYRLLETIRQYAADKLAVRGAPVVADARRRHASHYLALAERAAPALRGGPGQAAWMKRLDLEWPNLRTATERFHAGDDASSVVRLCASLRRWCAWRGNHELLPLLFAILPLGGDGDGKVEPLLRAYGDLALSWIMGTGAPSDAELATVVELVDAGLEIARRLDDDRLLAELLVLRASSARVLLDPDAVAFGTDAIAAARKTGDPGLIGLALGNAVSLGATVDARAKRGAEALRYLEEASDLPAIAGRVSQLSHDCLVAGDVSGAFEHARAAVRIAGELGGLIAFDGNLAVCALLYGDLEEAERAARAALVTHRRRNDTKSYSNFALWVLACCATRRGDAERAARITACHNALDAHLTETASHSFTWTPVEQEAREDNLRRLRELLGDDRFERILIEARAMPLDAAIDLALGRVGAR